MSSNVSIQQHHDKNKNKKQECSSASEFCSSRNFVPYLSRRKKSVSFFLDASTAQATMDQ